MKTKSNLVQEIIDEFKNGQPNFDQQRRSPFPPMLWIGDGRCIHVTSRLLTLIDRYTSICVSNRVSQTQTQTLAEATSMYRRAFAQAFDTLSSNLEIDALSSLVERYASDTMSSINAHAKLIVGCSLFNATDIYPISIGPVLFEAKNDWLARNASEGHVSSLTQRRVEAIWAGNPKKRRRRSGDARSETDILNLADGWPIICSIAADGLSQQSLRLQGLLAARLAMAAISVLHQQPSRILQMVGLSADGPTFSYASFTQRIDSPFYAGYFRPNLRLGYGFDDQVREALQRMAWLFELVGEALDCHLSLGKRSSRPNVMRWVYLSLWWLHEACREPSDQMVTVKFAACLDTIACGKQLDGICKLIEAQIGWQAGAQLMTDGRTVRQMVKEVYSVGRSRISHGSSTDYSQDWSERRFVAEHLARECLVGSFRTISDNPSIVDPKNLLKVTAE